MSITPRYQNHASAFSKIIGPGLTWKIVSDPHAWTQPVISEIKFLALSEHDIMHVIQLYQLEPIGFVTDVYHRKNQQERWAFGNVSTSSDSTRKEPRADMFREVRVGTMSDIGELGKQLTQMMISMQGPDHWDKMKKGEQDALVTLNSSGIEYRNVKRLWDKTMSSRRIVRIQRVQNVFLWQRYLTKKMTILSKNHGNANERWLWHGTSGTDPAKIWDGLNACGIDPRFGSGYYGNGAYFAVRAKYVVVCSRKSIELRHRPTRRL